MADEHALLDAAEELEALAAGKPAVTHFFTFGYDHAHAVGGFTYDKDVVVSITAPSPRAVMLRTFGRRWASEYATLEDVGLHHYPRGVKELMA